MARSMMRIAALGVLGLGTAACAPDPPSQCGENVAEVSRLDFSGSSTIGTAEDYDFEGYTVTVAIVRTDPLLPATVCYAVRDEDPWYKLFWAVDDVLDANFLTFPPQQDSRVFEGNFVLWGKNDEEVCGAGSIPGTMQVAGCSDEDDAEVYIHPYGSSGPSSPVHSVRIQ